MGLRHHGIALIAIFFGVDGEVDKSETPWVIKLQEKNCVDLDFFRDQDGYKCTDWKTHDCNVVALKDGYRKSSIEFLRANCPVACNTCDALSKNAKSNQPLLKARIFFLMSMLFGVDSDVLWVGSAKYGSVQETDMVDLVANMTNQSFLLPIMTVPLKSLRAALKAIRLATRSGYFLELFQIAQIPLEKIGFIDLYNNIFRLEFRNLPRNGVSTSKVSALKYWLGKENSEVCFLAGVQLWWYMEKGIRWPEDVDKNRLLTELCASPCATKNLFLTWRERTTRSGRLYSKKVINYSHQYSVKDLDYYSSLLLTATREIGKCAMIARENLRASGAFRAQMVGLASVVFVLCIISVVFGIRFRKQRRKKYSCLLGISLKYILTQFATDVRDCAKDFEWRFDSDSNMELTYTSFEATYKGKARDKWNNSRQCHKPPSNPNFIQIAPVVAYGKKAKGYNKWCPRDGHPHSSIVDAMVDCSTPQWRSAPAKFFISWVWGYPISVAIAALQAWIDDTDYWCGNEKHHARIWWCFFCNNQFRILQDEKQQSTEDLARVFGENLKSIGRMLIMMDRLQDSVYVKRIWCIVELYIATLDGISCKVILPKSAMDACRGVQTVKDLFEITSSIDTKHAKASMPEDEHNIKEHIKKNVRDPNDTNATNEEHAFEVINRTVENALLVNILSMLKPPAPATRSSEWDDAGMRTLHRGSIANEVAVPRQPWAGALRRSLLNPEEDLGDIEITEIVTL